MKQLRSLQAEVSGASRKAAMLRRAAITSGLLLAVLSAAPTRAEDVAPTRLEYRAPPSCPEVLEFGRRVNLRSARVHFVSEKTSGRVLYVEVRAQENVIRGTLRLIGRDGTERRRDLEAPTCDEAVDGLALIAALALDPDARAAAPATPAPAPAPSPSPAPAATPNSAVSAPFDDSSSRASLRAGIDVGALALLGTAPGPLFGGSVAASLQWNRASILSPGVRVSGAMSQRGTFTEAGGSAQFLLDLVALEACPFRFELGIASLRPCFFGSAALVQASGTQTSFPESHQLQRWDIGASGWAALRLSGAFEVWGDAVLSAPLRRDDYQFVPDVFFSTPSVAGRVGLGLGVGFP